jgi:serine/threonine protein kinase
MLLLQEVAAHLPKRIDRALAPKAAKLRGTDRMPRYRVRRDNDAIDSLVGTTVAGRYYVLSMLGAGGMSVVYKAKSLRRKPKLLALKTLRTQGLNDEVVVKRFQREAETLSGLNHPRIVQVHDYGYTQRGQPYFVMDYLVGENLSQVITRDGPISPNRVRAIFTQVCGAVDHAHRCGVIHRDLKPGNIMLLSLDGEHDFVKVVDFGIARFQSEAHRLTRLGEVWGSPVYMSPEQCMGKPLDVRSDVYSLGIAMYEALSAEVPFLGKSYVDTMSLQINEPAKPFKEVRSEIAVPERLEQVVMKALNKEPVQRYQSMGELREAIENAFAQMPASLRTSRNRVPAAAQPQLGKKSAAPKTAPASNKKTIFPILIAVFCVLAVLCFVCGMFAGKYLTKTNESSGKSEGTTGTTGSATSSDSDEDKLPQPGQNIAPPAQAPERVH